MQTGQQRFKKANLSEEELQYFWNYIKLHKWATYSLDVPSEYQTQLTVFSDAELRRLKRPTPPPLCQSHLPAISSS
jgi:hypothetical protein